MATVLASCITTVGAVLVFNPALEVEEAMARGLALASTLVVALAVLIRLNEADAPPAHRDEERGLVAWHAPVFPEQGRQPPRRRGDALFRPLQRAPFRVTPRFNRWERFAISLAIALCGAITGFVTFSHSDHAVRLAVGTTVLAVLTLVVLARRYRP